MKPKNAKTIIEAFDKQDLLDLVTPDPEPDPDPEPETDPYGHLTWTVGNSDDFWCFDYAMLGGGLVKLHAVVNSESAHFIADAEPPVTVPSMDAELEAQRLVYAAMDWCLENNIRFNRRDAQKFVKDVRKSVRAQNRIRP